MNKKDEKALCIMSGGMDSTLAAYMMKQSGHEIIALHFNYGQKTKNRELRSFEALCKELQVSNKYILNLDFFPNIVSSALTNDSVEIPTEGLKEGIPSTYVAFRNGIFLSIAAAIAEKEGAKAIAIGVVEEDSSGYPDCRESFIRSMQKSINLGTKDETDIRIAAPLVHLKKSQIVQEAIKLGVALRLTWSCYKNEKKACGVCDSCRLRLRGFEQAGQKDPIEYE